MRLNATLKNQVFSVELTFISTVTGAHDGLLTVIKINYKLQTFRCGSYTELSVDLFLHTCAD